jgi:hypothetical protein
MRGGLSVTPFKDLPILARLHRARSMDTKIKWDLWWLLQGGIHS